MAWVEREGVTFDPRYGTGLVDGLPQPVDTDISYALGDVAKAGVSRRRPGPQLRRHAAAVRHLRLIAGR